ncbi:MAG TPA: TetR/AcrR family transcriptional regulator [Anaerolineales bacterium]|nr:TetR/AcrR family transcriptional regulator [Anaerolineales bacterium]
MSNRQRIIDTALSLFNTQGTGAVSTNHIAEAAGISPGNLYYHYRNKEAIIRLLFERLFTAWDEIFQLPSDRALNMDDLEAMIAANYELIWEYRFAYRELAVLLRNDPELNERYLAVRRRGYQGFAELLNAFVASGVLSPPADAQDLAVITELCWIVSEQWPINLELSGQPFDAEGIKAGAALMRWVLKPLLIK